MMLILCRETLVKLVLQVCMERKETKVLTVYPACLAFPENLEKRFNFS